MVSLFPQSNCSTANLIDTWKHFSLCMPITTVWLMAALITECLLPVHILLISSMAAMFISSNMYLRIVISWIPQTWPHILWTFGCGAIYAYNISIMLGMAWNQYRICGKFCLSSLSSECFTDRFGIVEIGGLDYPLWPHPFIMTISHVL